MKRIIDKTIDVVKIQETEVDKQAPKDTLGSFESNVANTCLYTNDHIINSMENGDVVKMIQRKYPQFNLTERDLNLRKTFLVILEDVDFVKQVMVYYDLNILDLFKIIYKEYPSLFNALFIKKVQDVIARKRYVKQSKSAKRAKRRAFA